MRSLLLATILFIYSFSVSAQNVTAGIFGGISNYQGDLIGTYFVGRFTKPAIGLTASYDLTQRFSLRTGITFAKIAGDDQYNSKDYLRARNLSFETKLREWSLVGVYNLFNLDAMRWSPYVFGGAAFFHFNPYTNDSAGQKVFLRPLSTEGQGLEGYPERQPYALTQLSLPFGGGIKYTMSSRVELGLEAGIRKTFTDYLDDVSTNYADPADLAAGRGPQAVALSYRGDEVPGGSSAYPEKGAQRGGAKQKDIYYFTGLHLTYRFGGGRGDKRGKFGCPSVN